MRTGSSRPKCPLALHLINGLFDCQRSCLSVLGIAAQIPSAEIGSGYFQETHPQSLFQECSRCPEMIADASRKIGRPRQLYTGAKQRDYLSIAQRLSVKVCAV